MMPHSLIRISAVVTFVFASIAFAESPDVAAALADRAKYPVEDQKYIYYLTRAPYVGDQATAIERAAKLVAASNSRQLILNRSKLEHVGSGAFRLDLRGMEWSLDDWYTVAYERNPYAVSAGIPVVLRMDWFVSETSDMDRSDSYDRLFFGGANIPKTRAEFEKAFNVIRDERLAVGVVEGNSGVSKQKVRRITSLPVPAGSYWMTEDSLVLDKDRDPLEHLLGEFKHDGEEIIVGIPKVWLGDKDHEGQWGELRRYTLFNGKGDKVNFAPVTLVEDFRKTRDQAQINTPLSCYQCHEDGYNHFSKNELSTLLRSGADIFADYKQKASLESFHLSNLRTRIDRSNDDYIFAATMACDCSPREAAKGFADTVKIYDAPLTLEQTAAELDVTVGEWTNQLRTSSTLPARIASLAHGGTVPRAAWEQSYKTAWLATHGGQPLPQSVAKIVEPVEVEPAKVVDKSSKPAAKPAAKTPARQQQNNNSFRGRR